MKKLSIPLVILLYSLPTWAQVDPTGDFNRHAIANWKGDYIRVSQFRVKGTPYFLGESFPGSITYKDGRAVTGIKVLYDLYAQKAGIDLKGNEMFEEENGVREFTLELTEKFGGKKLLFVNADSYAGAEYKGYLNVLEDGTNLTLLKAYKIQLVTDPSQNLVKDVRAFDQIYHYYAYNKKANTLQKIKLKEKDLLKEMATPETMKAYSKDKALDWSVENDAIKLVRYYNSL